MTVFDDDLAGVDVLIELRGVIQGAGDTATAALTLGAPRGAPRCSRPR
jgi:hypothetical protein